MSLEGPVNVVINSTTGRPDTQHFSIQPSISEYVQNLTTSYANITAKGVTNMHGLANDLYYVMQDSRTCHHHLRF